MPRRPAMLFRLSLLVSSFVLGGLVTRGLAADPGQNSLGYRVGVAKVDITPEGPVMLSGYAARDGQMVDRVEQPISARALVIEPSEAPPVVLVSLELCGVPRSLVDRIAQAVKERHGVERARLAVCATHTHSAPVVTDLLVNIAARDLTADEQRIVDDYTTTVVAKTIAAIDAAFRSRVPARLGWGISQVDFAINRRNADGPVDHAVPFLVARDAQDRPVAIVAGYACHAVTLGPVPFISGDWAGCAVDAIEAAFPGATAVMLIGCGGDQNPHPSGATEQAVPRLHGQALAAAVRKAIGEDLRPVAGGLQVKFQQISLPLQPLPDAAEWKRRAAGGGNGAGGIEAYHAAKNLRRIEAGETLPTAIDYPIQSWVFGDDLAIAFLGGETVVDYSLALKATHGDNLWVTSYANDVACYIPSERVLEVGGYEGKSSMLWYDLPAPLAPGLQAKIIGTVGQQLPDSYRAPHDPARTGGKRPLSPAESIAQMQTHDDLRVELVVAEPLVIDPVAIDFGPDGRLWVAEMRDYPEGVDGPYEPGGCIRVLEDTDRDGKYDRAEVFLDGIPFPTGLMVWRGGVLVAAAPEVFFAEDTDGDGRADRRAPVIDGFATHNHQARVNSLSLGLDNWVHAAGGLFGGELQTSGGETVDVTNRDLRFLPDAGRIEAVTGRTQQGRVRDDWGNWFGCTNSVVLSHYPQTARYLRRNPLLVPPPPERYVPRGNESRQLFPRGELVQFSKSGPTGRPTSVCGLGIYRDRRLGDEYYGNAFVCEPVNQLVHRLILDPTGVTFEGRRADDEQTREFLTSTDNWFRPVQVRTGPDGALWVVDMYRYVIEHPRFISHESRARTDLRSGDQHGRIYRILPRDAANHSADDARATAAEWPPQEDAERSTAALVANLSRPNGTLRDMAHAELLWRADPAAAEPLRALVGSSPHAPVRLQALCVLDGLEALTEGEILRGLGDEHPAVRAHAVRLSERSRRAAASGERGTTWDTPTYGGSERSTRAAGSGAGGTTWDTSTYGGSERSTRAAGSGVGGTTWDTSTYARLRQMIAAEREPAVRLQLAYTVGQWPREERIEGLMQMLASDAADLDLRAAIFSGLRVEDMDDCVGRTLAMPDSTALRTATAELISMVAASDQKPLVGRVLEEVLRDSTDLPRTLRLLPLLLPKLAPEDLQQSTVTLEALAELRAEAGELLVSENLSDADLRTTLAFLVAMMRWSPDPQEMEAIVELLSPSQPPNRQRIAIDALARADSAAANDALLAKWGELTPAMRAVAFEGLMSRRSAAVRMVIALEEGTIKGAQLDSTQRAELAAHPDEAIRKRAAAYASMATEESRQEVLLQYQDLDPSRGDIGHGAEVFKQHCSACHRLNGVGLEVGPDLAALSDRSTGFLLTEILDPNRAVDGRYATYVAVTEDGRMVSGILSAEQDASITLKGQQAETTTVRRGEIAELINHGTSLMPEGLERVLPQEAMRDLLAYLQAAPSTAVRYEYRGNVSPHALYPDAGGRLADGQTGEARFDNPSWVGFTPDDGVIEIELQLPVSERVEAVVLHYGVNHTPGGIHAPRRVIVRSAATADGAATEHEFVKFDNRPDGLGSYQIDRRSTRIELASPTTGPIQLQISATQGWVFLSEIEVVRGE